MLNNLKLRLKQKAVDFTNNSEGNPLREQLTQKFYIHRSIKRGVPPLHVSIGKQIARDEGVNKGMGYLSLIARLNKRDASVIPQLLEHYYSDALLKILLNDASLITLEIEATGNSSIVQKAIEMDLIAVDDPIFQGYVTKRIDMALDFRRNVKARVSYSLPSDVGRQTLSALLSVLKSADITGFLTGSTLLGAVRDQAFLAGDDSLDIGVFESQIDANGLTALFVNSTFEYVCGDRHHIVLREEKTRVTVKIYPHRVENTFSTYGTNVHKWWHTPFSLRPYDFLGTEVQVPDQTERYLTERYGNWDTAVLYFDPGYDGPNHTFANSLESLLYLGDRTSRDFRRGKRHFADKGAFALRDYFNIDYTQYVPQPLNRYAIPFPITEEEIEAADIALVVGVFDQFDTAMISELEQELDGCDMLVLGVLGDELIQSQTGCHPKMAEIDRVNLARALAAVKHVVLLKTDASIENIIERLDPVKLSKNLIMPGELPREPATNETA